MSDDHDPSAAPNRGTSRGRFFRRNRRKLGILAALAVAIGVTAWLLHGEVDREAIVAYGRRIPVWGLVAGFVVLPLLGAPVSVFLLLIGIRLGLGWGMALTTAAMLFHIFTAYRLAHGLFRDRVRSWCERKGYGIPPVNPRHRAMFTAVFAAVHGPPYAAKLYLLALTDIPLRYHLWVGAPVYIFFAILPVAFGHAFTEMNFAWVIVLATIVLGTLVIGRWLKGKFSTSEPAS